MKTILVVDDTDSLRIMIKKYLSSEGFRIVTAKDGREAIFVARDEKPDLIILDLMMPEMDGYDFMRVYGREADTPIIILTAKLEEGDKVLGLELGADDYVTKPFGMRELTARVRAVLRRFEKANTSGSQGVLRAGKIMLDPDSYLCQLDGNNVNLTPSEFDLLTVLMKHPGRAFSRADLLDMLQGTSFEGYERTIDVHVRNLRTKVEEDASNPEYIETVYGIGYRFGKV
ncbi:MAG: DNA-binding response OmpR family regulator [Cellvibrionaceae bacterium]|jgi:DNA-binding response OmpR family regulator